MAKRDELIRATWTCTRRRLIAVLLMGGTVATLLSTSGCGAQSKTKRVRLDRGGTAVSGRMNESGVLFQSVAAQLRSLPEASVLQLNPPTVILDARTSADGGDVEATVTPVPGAPPEAQNVNNLLFVPKGNSRFRALDVQPGDIVKYYVLVDEESLQSDIVTTVAMELRVAQVLNDAALLIAGGLTAPVEQPARIEIWRTLDERMQEINQELASYARTGEPKRGWEPSPDKSTLGQMTERLNQWLRSRGEAGSYTVPKLLSTLPEALLNDKSLQPLLKEEALKRNTLLSHESRLLQEATWTRGVAEWTTDGKLKVLPRAQRLFDWTVRNITLSDDPRLQGNRPWKTMLYGRGTAAQRAWVFSLLCRQLDVRNAVVEISIDGKPWWLCLAIDQQAKQAYVFDPQLGLALPGAEDGQVATLAELQADETLLRKLDLPEKPYPLTAELLKDAVPLIVADPFALSWRAAQVEGQLSGEDSLAITVDADVEAEKLAELNSLKPAMLWGYPFKTIERQLTRGEKARNAAAIEFRPFAWRPKLWKARVLHMRGKLETEAEARSKNDALYDAVNDHRSAGQLYMARDVRPKETILQQVSPEKQRIYSQVKVDATYWLGVLQYDLGNPKSSIRWLEEKTLSNELADVWDHAVRYNLARAYEAQGDIDRAVELFSKDTSLQSHGNQLRAQGLKKQDAAE